VYIKEIKEADRGRKKKGGRDGGETGREEVRKTERKEKRMRRKHERMFSITGFLDFLQRPIY
jgi:hypothetical protein